jgi:hypothetical protein
MNCPSSSRAMASSWVSQFKVWQKYKVEIHFLTKIELLIFNQLNLNLRKANSSQRLFGRYALSNRRHFWCYFGGQFWQQYSQTIQIRHSPWFRIDIQLKLEIQSQLILRQMSFILLIFFHPKNARKKL